MIVLNAKGAKLAGRTLTLDGVSPNAIVFADRPIRAAGHALTAHLLAEWGDGAPDSFAKDSAQRHGLGAEQGQAPASPTSSSC